VKSGLVVVNRTKAFGTHDTQLSIEIVNLNIMVVSLLGLASEAPNLHLLGFEIKQEWEGSKEPACSQTKPVNTT